MWSWEEFNPGSCKSGRLKLNGMKEYEKKAFEMCVKMNKKQMDTIGHSLCKGIGTIMVVHM